MDADLSRRHPVTFKEMMFDVINSEMYDKFPASMAGRGSQLPVTQPGGDDEKVENVRGRDITCQATRANPNPQKTPREDPKNP